MSCVRRIAICRANAPIYRLGWHAYFEPGGAHMRSDCVPFIITLYPGDLAGSHARQVEVWL